jgi:hypothetical protein
MNHKYKSINEFKIIDLDELEMINLDEYYHPPADSIP